MFRKHQSIKIATSAAYIRKLQLVKYSANE